MVTATHSLPLFVNINLPNGNSYEQPTGLFIDNEFVLPQEKKTFGVVNPSTDEEITHVYEALDADVDAAVDAATRAFNSDWSRGEPAFRGRVLNKLADLIEEHAEILASIESLNNGKSLICSRGDIKLSVNLLRTSAGFADKITGSVVETGSSHLNYIRREPVGVCGQIIPWNFPLFFVTQKLGPVLSTGCTTVLKTAESTPLSALYLANLIKEAGVPKGVVNIVSGFGKTTGNALAYHLKINKIAFTGSTVTGRAIMKAAAESNLKKVTLELGGKSPNIVFNDADIPKTVKNLAFGIFFNTGEVCCAGSRVYVQSGIYDEVLAAFKKEAESIKVGNPFDEDVFMGAQASTTQMEKVLDYIESGKNEGATIVTGGSRIGNKGNFIKPTIFADVREHFKIVKDEIFGPVVTLTKFDTAEEVIKMANDSEYGLAAGIHTENINTAITVANRINSGTVWVNTYNDFHPMIPFGGYNQSGFGREMGTQVLDDYTQVKAVRVGLKPLQ